MDMIDILGGLLKGKAGASGGGVDIFGDILKRAGQPQKSERSSPKPQGPQEGDLAGMARELEDLLHVARDRGSNSAAVSPQQAQHTAPQRHRVETGSAFPIPSSRQTSERPESIGPTENLTQNDQALFLVRAMMNAAKADGRVTPDEHKRILAQFDNASPDVMQFLNDELNRAVDVREFAWSVPIGLEHQVYAMSLLAIDVDSLRESDYLNELAHGLRLPAEVRSQLQQRYTGGSVR